MKTFIGLFFVLAFAVVPAFADDAAVAGVWKVTGSVYGNPVDSTCTVKQEGKTLSGSCKSGQTGETAITGSVDGKKVTWQFNADFNGTPITIIFNGSVDDAAKAISGSINVQPFNVDGDFTAAKEEPKKDK